jgi:magnesium-transporting ATPase (P-type)
MPIYTCFTLISYNVFPLSSPPTMAVGTAYLTKKKAIVQNLSAIESLAGEDSLL